MKQFLTLCMAAAMVGSTTLSLNAGVTLQQAMQMQKEGKAIKAINGGLKRLTTGMKPLRQAPVSRFHKIMSDKAEKAMKGPQKIMANGDNIYGYLGYSSDQSMLCGAYEFSSSGNPTMVWEDGLYYENMAAPSGLGYDNGVLKGYSMASLFGMFLIGIYYEEVDAMTGEVLAFEPQDLNTNMNYFQTVTYDPENKQFIGYGAIDGEMACMSAPADDPFNYTYVSTPEDGQMCLGLTYNPVEKAVVGVNLNYELVKLAADGSQEVIMNLDVPEGSNYISGITYDGVTDLYYWNVIRTDMTCAMATIDVKNKQVNVYHELDGMQEYLFLYTPDQPVAMEAPKRPGCEGSSFYKNSLTGYVTYTLPTETVDGKAIAADAKLGYRTYVDGELYSTGNAAPGEEVKANFAVAPDQTHVFGMAAVLDGIEGAPMNVRVYVGNDTPLAPQNVVLTEEGITWDEVTEGVHGGYMDLSKMEYTVYLNGDILGTTSETSFSHRFDPEAELKAYQAEVVATCNGLTGSSAYSNAITSGAALQLPQYIEPTEEEFALSSVLDANADGVGWYFDTDIDTGEGYVYTDYSAPGESMNDWFFLPKMAFDDPEKFYTFSFETAIRGIDYPNEYVEVLLCNEPNERGVVGTIIDEFSPEGEAYEIAMGQFKVRQPGAYYIAIHCTSDGDMFGVKARNFSVEDNNITIDSPYEASDISAEAAEGGVLKATVHFTMPTTTMGDNEYPAGKELKATVSGGEAEVEVTGAPGEEMAVTVDAVPGANTFTVVISDGDLNSPMVWTSVRCGYDVPSCISDLRSTTSEDMLSIRLEWDPVTTGWIDEDNQDSGVIDPSKVTYDIYKVGEDGYWAVYDSGISDTNYTYSVEPGSEQASVRLGVVACNEIGDNGYLLAANGILGDPLALPINEDFDNGGFTTNPWMVYTIAGEPQFGLYETKNLSDAYADKETVCLGITASGYYTGEVGMLGTPRFSTKGDKEVTLTLEVSGDFKLPKTTILAEAYGIEAEEVGEITCSEAGFHKVSVSLPEKFLGLGWVGLYIQCEFETGEEALVVESISIDNGSGVRTLDMSGVKIAGGKNQIKVSGLRNQSVTVSALDGRVAAQKEKVSGNATFDVQKGIYVVKAGNKNAKVVVK